MKATLIIICAFILGSICIGTFLWVCRDSLPEHVIYDNHHYLRFERGHSESYVHDPECLVKDIDKYYKELKK